MMSTFVVAVILAQHRELRGGPPFLTDAAVRLAYMKGSVASSGSCPGDMYYSQEP
jgi:hypothetical protein